MNRRGGGTAALGNLVDADAPDLEVVAECRRAFAIRLKPCEHERAVWLQGRTERYSIAHARCEGTSPRQVVLGPFHQQVQPLLELLVAIAQPSVDSARDSTLVGAISEVVERKRCELVVRG